MKKPRISPAFIGILQGSGLLVYIAVVGFLMLSSNRWFGPNPNLLGPITFLALFVFSAIFSAGIILGYPFYVFWEKKDLKSALIIVAASAGSLFIYILFTLLVVALTQ